MAPRYPEHASHVDVNVYTGAPQPTPRMLVSQEPACAFLTMDLQIAKATQTFGEAIGVQSAVARNLHDVVSASDRDKVFRLQRVFEDERREREPNYLPPIYLKFEENRVIQSVGFGPDEMAQLRTDRSEMFTFQGPDGQQRTFQVHFGLAKKESTYFIVLMLHIPATPQTHHQPSSSPFSQESQHGYLTPQQGFSQIPMASPFVSTPSLGERRSEGLMTYRPIGPMVSSIGPSTGVPPYTQSQTRPDYSQGQTQYQNPRSELPQSQAQRQHNLQLPPIRSQPGDDSSMDPIQRRDDRSSRVDIGGLLEKPDPTRRRN